MNYECVFTPEPFSVEIITKINPKTEKIWSIIFLIGMPLLGLIFLFFGLFSSGDFPVLGKVLPGYGRSIALLAGIILFPNGLYQGYTFYSDVKKGIKDDKSPKSLQVKTNSRIIDDQGIRRVGNDGKTIFGLYKYDEYYLEIINYEKSKEIFFNIVMKDDPSDFFPIFNEKTSKVDQKMIHSLRKKNYVKYTMR